MDYDREDRGPVTILSLIGEIGADENAELDGLLKGLLGEGRVRIAIDAAELDYINSSGVSALVQAYQKAMALGGELVLVRPSRPVLKVLTAVGISAFIKIVDSVEEAVDHLG